MVTTNVKFLRSGDSESEDGNLMRVRLLSNTSSGTSDRFASFPRQVPTKAGLPTPLDPVDPLAV